MNTATDTKSEAMTDLKLMALLDEHTPEVPVKVRLKPEAAKVALQYVGSIITKGAKLPILTMIRCQTNGTTKFTSTDLDQRITVELDQAAENEGTILLPKESILNAVKSAKREVVIDVKGLSADIISDGWNQKAHLLDPLDFPASQPFKPMVTVMVSLTVLKAGIKRVAEAISTDDTRYVLNGICMEVTPDSVRLIATDGRRLHFTNIPRLSDDAACQWEINKALLKRNFIIPTDTVKSLLKMPAVKGQECVVISAGVACGQPEYDKAGVMLEMTLASFTYDAYTLESKLIEGRYPNYPQVIPNDDDIKTRFDVDPVAMSAAIRNVMTVCTEKSNSIKLVIEDTKMAITASSPEKGEARTELPITNTGDRVTIAFNPEYMIDIMESFKSGPVRCMFANELAPGVFVQDQTKSKAVVMPMRLT